MLFERTPTSNLPNKDNQMLDASAPKFSVIVPVHNEERSVARCLRSILDQTYEKFEVILVNDGSTDQSLAEIEKIRDSRCRVLHREKGEVGPGPARNVGVAHAKYPWCAFLDADDQWKPDYLEQMVNALQSLPSDIGLLFSGFHITDSVGRTAVSRYYARHREPTLKTLDFAGFIEAWIANKNSPNFTSATVIRTDLLREIGGFPERACCRRGEDKDTWLRTVAKAHAAYVPFVGMIYTRGDICDSVRATWYTQTPCLCSSINELLTEVKSDKHRKLLKRLQNTEIFLYALESSRVARVPRQVFSDFFVLEDPLRYALILALWLTPKWLLDEARKARRRIKRSYASFGRKDRGIPAWRASRPWSRRPDGDRA